MSNAVIRTCKYFEAIILILADRYTIIGKGVTLLQQSRKSKFAKQAGILFVCNVLSRGISFFANAYAARCLGAFNFGVSGVIQNMAKPASLFADLGFDSVATRKIASDADKALQLTSLIIGIRVLFTLLIGIVWLVVCFCLFEGRELMIWSISSILLFNDASFGALRLTFAYQGLERVHIQTIISTLGSVLIAVLYFIYFHRDMPMGSDLLVLVSVNSLVVFASWVYFFKNIGRIHLFNLSFAKTLELLKESWPFGWNNFVMFLYGGFQLPLIAFFIGTEGAGIFRAAWTMSNVLQLLFNSISFLLIPRLTKWRERGAEVLKTKQTLLVKLYLLMGVPIIIVLALFSDLIFNLFLGPAFHASSGIFKILIVAWLIAFIAQIFSLSLIVLKKDKHFAVISTVGAIVSVGLNLIFLPIFGLYAAAVVTIINETFIGFIFYYFYQKHKNDHSTA